jgi:putative membrane protein
MGALSNHRLYVRTLPLEDIPQLAMPWLTSLLSVVLALIGFLLAAYLTFV